jgi:hypothetical protein
VLAASPALRGVAPRRQGPPPAEATEAYICCDRDNIYVAFRCHDSKPGEIKRVQRKRDGATWADDYVDVGLDTYHEHEDPYLFTVTARGTQREYMPGGVNVPKIEWRGDWRAAAQVSSDGWTAELAIPFGMLRYANGGRIRGVGFGRQLAREQGYSIWPPMGESYSVEKYPDWVDLELPSYHEPTLLLPYAVAESGRDLGNRMNFGLDVKRPLPNGMLLFGTYRPDFRKIEDVVETVDFTHTERYLPERRPFFVESWQGPSTVLYTRRIHSIRDGLAFKGDMGRHALSLLYVDALEQGEVMAMQYAYDLGPMSQFVSAFASERGGENPGNLAGMIGLGLGRNTDIGSEFVGSRCYRSHSDGEGGDGQIRQLWLDSWRGQGRLSFWGQFYEVAASYNNGLGFVPETGIRQVGGGVSWSNRREKGRARDVSWSSAFSIVDSLTDRPSYYYASASAGRELRNHTWQSLGRTMASASAAPTPVFVSAMAGTAMVSIARTVLR